MREALAAFETCDAAAVRHLLAGGLDPNADLGGKPATQVLVETYYRSDEFPKCLRAMLDAGGQIDDRRLIPILLDDIDLLEQALRADPGYLRHRVDMPCAFTSLENVGLLHVAVEYGHEVAAKWLLDHGADVNARAVVDDDSGGGHTPIFHAVSSNANRSAPLLKILLERGADTHVRVSSLWWGRGFPWETMFFDVTPISYAQMGLLPQVHRGERDVYDNIELMLSAAGRPEPHLRNIPNRYLLN